MLLRISELPSAMSEYYTVDGVPPSCTVFTEIVVWECCFVCTVHACQDFINFMKKLTCHTRGKVYGLYSK